MDIYYDLRPFLNCNKSCQPEKCIKSLNLFENALDKFPPNSPFYWLMPDYLNDIVECNKLSIPRNVLNSYYIH
jgi:hypothetical protein